MKESLGRSIKLPEADCFEEGGGTLMGDCA